jgi:hypothetical protein
VSWISSVLPDTAFGCCAFEEQSKSSTIQRATSFLELTSDPKLFQRRNSVLWSGKYDFSLGIINHFDTGNIIR